PGRCRRASSIAVALMSHPATSIAMPARRARASNRAGTSPEPVATSRMRTGRPSSRARTGMTGHSTPALFVTRLMRASAASARRCSAGSSAGSSINSAMRRRVRRPDRNAIGPPAGVGPWYCREIMTQPNPPQPGGVEREFGVPFPGRIGDPAKWTQAALKVMPEGVLDWRELFGRDAPVVLDLGCGNGRYLIGSAILRPGHDHLGTDILPV